MIWNNLGDKEVDDMAAACSWLIEQGIARSDAIFATGGSYGGYLTLQALGRRPELWAGGMAEVAIADWTLMYEDQMPMLRSYQVNLLGGTPQECPEQYRKSSPITYAEHVSAPLLIIQGRNDARCPARQIEVYERRLRELGKTIEIIWFDAGHVSSNVELRIEHVQHKLDFAHNVLASRDP